MIDSGTIPAAVRDAARRYGENEAVVDGDRRVSFAELEALVAAAASALRETGLGAGDRMALWAPNSLNWILACAGAMALGATIVPLNTRMKGGEAADILNRTRTRLLVTVDDFLGMSYPAVIAREDVPHLRHVLCLDDTWQARLAIGAEWPAGTVAEGAVADIIFTSGTTGTPKGVLSGHGQNVETAAKWARRVGLRAGDRYLLVNPFFHTFGYKAGWLACLLTGATAVPMKTFDIENLADVLGRESITVLTGAPTIFQSLLDRGMTAPTLRVGVTGAASVPPILIARMRDELGIPTVLTGYGLTESTGVVSLTDADDSAEVAATTAGRPIPGIEVRCVTSTGDAVSDGEEGEIVVRGPNVMLGYLDDPAATAETIDEDGWLHTGDIGRFVGDGCLQITDRIKDMYICGGFNCYPAEIERILCTCDGVAAASVIGVPDARMGEVGKAFILPRPGARLDAVAILAWAREAMANYKVPRSVEIVDALPTNASGKVLKYQLRQPQESQAGAS